MFVHCTGHYLVVSKGWYFGIDLILDVLIISFKFKRSSSLGISLSLSKINYLISDNRVSKYSFYTYCVLVYIALERRGGGGRRCFTRQEKIKFFIHYIHQVAITKEDNVMKNKGISHAIHNHYLEILDSRASPLTQFTLECLPHLHAKKIAQNIYEPQ